LSLDEGVSRFIGRIYESVYEADAWNALMYELMDRTGSRMAFVSWADVRHREYTRSGFYGREDSSFAIGADEYIEEMHRTDPSLAWASTRPDAGLCDTSKIMSHDEFRMDPYVRWQESRFRTVHWCVFYTKPVDDLSFALSLHPPGSEGPASIEQLQLHKLLFEHMERALRLASRPPDLATAADAVIVLDTAGQVLSMSPRAEQLVTAADGLTIERRRLSAMTLDGTARLNCAIASAVKSGVLGGAGGGVRLERPSGRADWLALVSPCPRHLEHLPVRTPAAVLRIIEAAPNAPLSPAHAELFDLSPREAQVAEALLGGHSVESLCALLAISRNTAKAHLQSIFRKTGTNRQSELVHLLANVARG
jgi:DNA-binding CsgD family transcriptional regulator/PAS domain-containing protein